MWNRDSNAIVFVTLMCAAILVPHLAVTPSAAAGPADETRGRGESLLSAKRIGEVQRLLDQLNYRAGAIDGRLDHPTEAALRAFRANLGIDADILVTEPDIHLNKELLDSLRRSAEAARAGSEALGAIHIPEAFATIVPGDEMPYCGFQLTGQGCLRLRDGNAEPQDFCSPTDLTWTHAVMFPASPSGRYRLVKASAYETPNLLLHDTQTHSLRVTRAGKYGPELFARWSRDESLAVLKSANEGVEWLHVIDATTGESVEHPCYGTTSQRFDSGSVTWTGPTAFKVRMAVCNGDCRDESSLEFAWREITVPPRAWENGCKAIRHTDEPEGP